MSLRDGVLPSKQSPRRVEDNFGALAWSLQSLLTDF